jgi:hypothetical protein
LLKSICMIFITTILYLCLRLKCLGVVRIVARTRIVDVFGTPLTHYFWCSDLLEEYKHKLQFKGPTSKGPNKGYLVRCRHRKSIEGDCFKVKGSNYNNWIPQSWKIIVVGNIPTISQ